MAYRGTPNFAYPGWRLTIPGGPAGGHYKGWTHNYQAGSTLVSGPDDYELTRAAGSSAHDTLHVHPNAPRGVYRGPAETRPRPNASGQLFTYQGYQTKRHAGTSIAPGAFPAPYEDTGEEPQGLRGLGLAHVVGLGVVAPVYTSVPPECAEVAWLPGWQSLCADIQSQSTMRQAVEAPPPAPAPAPAPAPVVPQPAPILTAPGPAVSDSGIVPISPGPAPTVASHELIKAPDGSGQYFDSSTGVLIPGTDVVVDASGRAAYRPGAQPASFSWAGIQNWLAQNTIWSAVPNWMLLAGAGALIFASLRGKHR